MPATNFIPALRFNWLTRFYDGLLAISFPEKKMKTTLIDQLGLTGNEAILDFGIGTATLSIMIKQRFPSVKVTGVDVDKEILRIAKRKISGLNLEIDLHEYDGSQLPFPESSWDRIISSLVFHHIPTENKKIVLKEIYRCLKPGAELHIADFGKAATAYTKLAFGLFRRLDGEANTRVNSKGLLPDFIQEAGFVYVEETKYFNTVFGTVRLLKAVKPVF
ncbi:MAG TPA: class I SAM-dependent methyltransferase [Chitinophagaceae bacterium]|nr:class I SAM-dependent methyltransferase [Chitinophagaceae bacterium]